MEPTKPASKKRRISYRQCIANMRTVLRDHNDVVFVKYGTAVYSAGNGATSYDLFKISSREIAPSDKILLIRAGIHGDEITGPLTLMKYIGRIFDYANHREVKLIIFPLDNPSGFEAGSRYNVENDRGDGGNNDFLRYELSNGKIVGDIGASNVFKQWYWSSDPALGIRLPKETRLLHTELKKLPLRQVIGVVDLHQNDSIPIVGAYHYAFGDVTRYIPITQRIEKKVPILRGRYIDAGYVEKPEFDPEIPDEEQKLYYSFSNVTDDNGFIIRHDGTLTDLFDRIGAAHAITVETTGVTPRGLADKVNLIWIYGLIDLIAVHSINNTKES